MGRAPCCEKVGLNRGPWTKEEDQMLINFIKENGHGNWRALPKKAGLLRCGKSCRLRWTNYLRPDIIRGNFTKEEEDNIISLHKELGNKWSIIAAKLPGRTDNEIKNVWHTHLKKRLVDKNNALPEKKKSIRKRSKKNIEAKKDTSEPPQSTLQEGDNLQNKKDENNGPRQEAKSENSAMTTMTTSGCSASTTESMEKFVIDDEFWSDVFSGDCPNLDVNNQFPESQFALPSYMDVVEFDPSSDAEMDFWYNVFTKEGDLQELLESL
ncbi:hypothetical protein Leryth_020967 [Lithospermum erythrorhizon]|nr:hypothetical protein Leryth_020967 [Lithospermum erythrorhizon]